MTFADDLLALDGDHPGQILGWRIVAVRATTSTNDDAIRWLDAHGPRRSHGVTFVAGEQTRGRGTRGRRWISAQDAMLPISIILAPNPPLARPAVLTLAAGLAIVRAGAAAGARTYLKWPNDVVDRDGRKIAGILAETRTTSPPCHVLGIGVNVRPLPANLDLEAIPSSLVEAGAPVASPAAFVFPLLTALAETIGELHREGIAGVARRFNESSWLAGRRVRLRRGHEEQTGRFSHLDDDLRIVLDRDGATIAVGPAEQLELVRDAETREPPDCHPVSDG